MHNHFDKNLNLHQIILKHRPNVIVECGAGTGNLTRQIASMRQVYDFDFKVISDSQVDVDGIEMILGISYTELAKLEDDSIDLCIIDTDHNYWTLRTELKALDGKLKEGGFVAFHDVSTFYHDSGIAESYSDGTPYPRELIDGMCSEYGGIGNALMDFLSQNRFRYRMITFTSESHGACLIQKKNAKYLAIQVPDIGAIYAKPQRDR